MLTAWKKNGVLEILDSVFSPDNADMAYSLCG
jgi:hypothetical protein